MMNEEYLLDNYKRPKLETPDNSKKILLHSCCAPCAGEVMDALAASDIDVTIFFYNPNIHPTEEYIIRKEENKRYADKLGMAFIDADYDKDNWFNLAKGMENEPEKGIRCTMCFDMRFVKTAEYASKNAFTLISSTLGISKWKNMEQINTSGKKAASLFENIQYWDLNWRKKGGSYRMLEISKKEKFYQQEYCGCAYSLRDTNKWRTENGKEKIKRGIKYYSS
ncbi:hypothetical protein fh0823_20000 [Francisella halioticida]|nr:hypothetical protein fh0823_20000 [Francisella halioticida]